MSRNLVFVFHVFLQVSLYECGTLLKKDVVPEKVDSGLSSHRSRARRSNCPDCPRDECGFCLPLSLCRIDYSDGSCCECDKRGCFASSARVSLKNGRKIAMSELQIGDWVQAASSEGKLIYSEVRTFMKKEHTYLTMYKTISTSLNNTMSLTGDHLIYSRKGSSDKFHPISADQLVIGDELLVQGNGQYTTEKVLNVSHLIMQGAYTPVTMNGNIVVDGVLASCYAFADHDMAHMGMTPLRWFPEIMEFIFGADIVSPGYVTFLQNTDRWIL